MLKSESQQLKLLHQQLISESLRENECPKRLLLLKSQLFQLERQNQLIALRANQRQESLQTTHNELNAVLLGIAGWVPKDGKGSKDIVVPRSDIAQVVKTIKGVMLSLNKPTETVDTVKQNMAMMNKFRVESENPTSKIDFNLKNIGHLEQQLSELYLTLEEIKTSPLLNKQATVGPPLISKVLKEQTKTSQTSVIDKSCSLNFPSNLLALQNKLQRASSQITSCCEDLTELSLLNPQQPSSRSRISKQISLEEINSYVKKFTRKKEVFDAINITYKISHHKAMYLQHKCTALEQEVASSHSRLELHTKFVEDILQSLADMFTEFEAKVLKLYYSDPLTAILNAYHTLQHEHSNENMTSFFKCIEANELNLEHSLKLLKHVGVADSSGVSELQTSFTDTMRSYTTSLLQKRDTLDTELIELSKESAEKRERLKGMLIEKEIVENIKNAVEDKRQNKS